MRVHNLVKDLVVQKVEEIFTQKEELQRFGLIPDEGSKLDVICYVLNRTAPQYVVSGRGVAYNESQDYTLKFQQLADLSRLVKEGFESVSKRQRERSVGSFEAKTDGLFYNFPSFIGRMFNGLNFEPIYDVEVGLYYKGELVKVIDPNWQNPYRLVQNTAGTYLFWPHPIEAPSLAHEATFEFELRVSNPKFEPLGYFFEVKVKSEREFVDFVNTTSSLRLKDLYLFPRDLT